MVSTPSKSNNMKKRGNKTNYNIYRPFPSTVRVLLPYYEKGYSIGGGLVGLANTQLCNIGSIFDPDTTGVGHQPLGHDQYAAIYEQYVVLNIMYEVVIANFSAAQVVVAGVTISDSLTPQTDVRVLVENGGTDWRTLGFNGSNTAVATFKGKVNIAKVHGLTESEHISAHLAQFGANPAESVFMHVWAADGFSGTAPTVQCSIRLMYDVLLKGAVFTSLS